MDGLKKQNKSNTIFFVCLVALPLVQFFVFYICVNSNSIILAFKNYDSLTGNYSFAGFKNFQQFFIQYSEMNLIKTAIKNSLIVYACTLLIGTTLGLLFSYFVYKKAFCSPIFKNLLFLPSIVSSIVMVLLFTQFVERALPVAIDNVLQIQVIGLLSNAKTVLGTIIFYNIWVSFGPVALMYVGAMNGVPESVLEAGKIDGTTDLKEFIYIILPMIFPTIVVFLTVGIAAIFTNQINLYAFFGPNAEPSLYTIGYYLYRNTQVGTIADYPYYSAVGILMTFVAIILTFTFRFILKKWGPSQE